jgi:iron complex transport system substrate-binding protein
MFKTLFLSLLLTNLLLQSCGDRVTVFSQQNQAENNTNSSQSQVPQRSIKHAMGTTQIAGTPQRVVVLTNEANDIVLALGLTPVGAVKSWLGDPYYDYIEEDMQGVPMIGDEFQPNLEKIVALKPDLIIGSKVRQGQIYEQLNAIAPTVFSETIGVTWQENLKLYAQALNREAEAKTALQNWQNRVNTFKQKLQDRSDIHVSLVRFAPGMARIYYKDTFPGQILEEVGLQRPPQQNKDEFADEVSFENIPQMDGDILFYFTYDEGDNRGQTVAQQWLNHPLWHNLKVVKRDRVYAVNDTHWTTAGGIQSAHRVLDDLNRYLFPSQQHSINSVESPSRRVQSN